MPPPRPGEEHAEQQVPQPREGLGYDPGGVVVAPPPDDGVQRFDQGDLRGAPMPVDDLAEGLEVSLDRGLAGLDGWAVASRLASGVVDRAACPAEEQPDREPQEVESGRPVLGLQGVSDPGL